MKAIQIGDCYEICDDTLQTYDQLPVKTYAVCFSKMKGFFLVEHNDLSVNEKIYGVHMEKVNKVINAFPKFDRSLGVILSGDKGMGKSVFAKLLANKAISNGIPVIIVDKYVPGIAGYIETIEQEVMILFDEFDKTFKESDEENANRQDELLSLFDGVSTGKKLFVVTCNEIYCLSDYLINRPGRFHYHFRFKYPNNDEIREYLQDKLDEQYWEQIDSVIAFANRVPINYDCLRAITFEINTGAEFGDAIQDLNIVNVCSENYNISIRTKDGKCLIQREFRLDMFDEKNKINVPFYDDDGYLLLSVIFCPAFSKYVAHKAGFVLKSGEFSLDFSEDGKQKKIVESIKKANGSYLLITLANFESIHFNPKLL